MLRLDVSSCRQTVGKSGWPARWALSPCAKASTLCGRGGLAAACGGADNRVDGIAGKLFSLCQTAIAAVERFHRRIEIRLGFLQLPFKSRVIQRASKGAAFRLRAQYP